MNTAKQKQTLQTIVPGDYSAGWLDKLDGRYQMAREMRGRFDEVAADLGGKDSLSYMQRSLIERALWLEYWLADQERQLAAGEDFAIGGWVQATNSLQGIWARLGLKRKAKPAQTLGDYMRGAD